MVVRCSAEHCLAMCPCARGISYGMHVPRGSNPLCPSTHTTGHRPTPPCPAPPGGSWRTLRGRRKRSRPTWQPPRACRWAWMHLAWNTVGLGGHLGGNLLCCVVSLGRCGWQPRAFQVALSWRADLKISLPHPLHTSSASLPAQPVPQKLLALPVLLAGRCG